MSDHDHSLPEEKARTDEYAELWRRIGDGGWIPGDIFCTSQGVTRQFRETPYTSEFRRCRNGTGWNRLLRITASPDSRTMLDARLDCCAAESQRGPMFSAPFVPHAGFAVCSQSDGDEFIRESTMTRPPHRSVLRKIAARRTRLGHTDPHPAWISFMTASAAQPGKQARRAVLGGPQRLTRRELEVLELVARGETDQRIADQLYLSRRTINCHVANILTKLDVRSRTAAVMTAARIGLL